jgi:hypothetical protein
VNQIIVQIMMNYQQELHKQSNYQMRQVESYCMMLKLWEASAVVTDINHFFIHGRIRSQ